MFEKLLEICRKQIFELKGLEEEFTFEIYADYRDDIEDSTIKEICEANNSLEHFNDLVFNWYEDEEWEEKERIVKVVIEFYEEEFGKLSEDEKEEAKEYLEGSIFGEYPFKHYMNQEVCCDLIIDTGDGNYDFNCNELWGCIYSNGGYDRNSSLVWLMKQQGYSAKVIRNFIKNPEEYKEDKFLWDVYEEGINTTSCMNCLCVPIKMSLGEMLELKEELETLDKKYKEFHYYPSKRRDKGYLVIDKSSSFGLYDSWNGAGSIFDITPNKDVKIPLKYISDCLIDGYRGYSIREIYGVSTDFWDGKIKEIKLK